MRNRNPLRAATGGIFLIGLAIAFALGDHFGGNWFIAIFFITLACTSFIGSLNFNRRGVYSGSYGFVWLLMLALFFITGSWLWFLVGAGLSAILGSLWRPMMRGAFNNRQPYYQPTSQQPPTYQPYEQGYQPPAQQPQQPPTIIRKAISSIPSHRHRSHNMNNHRYNIHRRCHHHNRAKSKKWASVWPPTSETQNRAGSRCAQSGEWWGQETRKLTSPARSHENFPDCTPNNV